MQKGILLSTRPKWVAKIAHKIGEIDGKAIYEKTIEVRKTRPKLETPFKVFIYCTKGRGDCLWEWRGHIAYDTQFPNERPSRLDGKVIGEFVCDRIDSYVGKDDDNREYWDLSVKEWEDLKGKSCLTIKQICDYTGDSHNCYGWHISNLKIYDKPKELYEFYPTKPKPMNKWTDNDYCQQCKYHKWIGSMKDFVEKGKPMREKCTLEKPEPICEYTPPITRPPQSWCYVEAQK